MIKNTILYFLRSSENKIVSDMLHYAYRLDSNNKTKEEIPHLSIYDKFYGLTSKDLGLYALVDKTIAGAVWVRLLKKEDNSTAFIDEKTAVLSMAVLPIYRAQGLGTNMMEQFLQEAGALYEQLSVNVTLDSGVVKFYEKFGFTKIENSQQKSLIDGKTIITMIKKLEKKEVIRPKDNYNASYWMD